MIKSKMAEGGTRVINDKHLCIINAYKYIQREANRGLQISLARVYDRVSAMLNISKGACRSVVSRWKKGELGSVPAQPHSKKCIMASPNKRLRTEEPPAESLPSSGKFKDFIVTRVLNDVPEHKLMAVLGKFPGSDDKAVVVLEKTAFSEETAKLILSEDTTHSVNLENDIYHSYQLYPTLESNAVKASLVYPASDKHIAKYSAQTCHLVDETPDDYNNITLKHINDNQFSIQWVYNILDKKTESERIVFEDSDPQNGFILLPDMKWDGKTVDCLYLVAIVHRHGIKSLRDLNESHLPLLRNILKRGSDAIHDKYGVPSSRLRVYVHYQPSYYHLHVHFTHLKFQAGGCNVERAHLLSDVIDNIKLDPQFYSRKTLTFTLRESDPLFAKYKESGKIDTRD